ncbi:AAA family ATPase [Streptomyces sp. APSN-46.1]|uniref:AAA family ATPase n=1 Tax=Streptomyces sp. APSN-46.1 TaxID=2929049 RepID=UPI001FB30F4A|nr:AAA family ATPase [Streptomyces sp. APSN-46.1]MCJ1676263.1 AAA family ATPase [Streptomyces sp. APSN-46.1]
MTLFRLPVPDDRQTAAGWQRWCRTRHCFVPARRLSREEFARLSPVEQEDYLLHRDVTNSNLPLQETPMSEALSRVMRSRLRLGAFKVRPSTRRGLIINGGGCQGKTETACEVAAWFEEYWRAKHHDTNPDALAGTRDLHIPVAYVQTPVTAKPKSTCKAILDFYGADHKGMDLPALIRAVRRHVHAHGTRAILLDDITRLKLHRRDDQDVFDMLKGFMDMSATLVLIGVDVPASGLLQGAVLDEKTGDWIMPSQRGAPVSQGERTQHLRRFTMVDLGPFPYETPQEMAAFLKHLKGIEDHICLFDAVPGMLTTGDMPEYLHDRTGGVVGLLECLIEDAIELAIDIGHEELTTELMRHVAISVEGLPSRDASAGEVPVLPEQPPAHERKKRPRNRVFDDQGPQSATGTGQR